MPDIKQSLLKILLSLNTHQCCAHLYSRVFPLLFKLNGPSRIALASPCPHIDFEKGGTRALERHAQCWPHLLRPQIDPERPQRKSAQHACSTCVNCIHSLSLHHHHHPSEGLCVCLCYALRTKHSLSRTRASSFACVGTCMAASAFRIVVGGEWWCAHIVYE